MKRIYVISGGTMVHVRPHFALCAPAYGTIGDRIAETLAYPNSVQGYETIPLFTRMAREKYEDWDQDVRDKADDVLKAAGLKHLETNEDLKVLIDHLVSEPTTRCIVLAAAVCDWEPAHLIVNNAAGFGPPATKDFGKDQPRLHTRDGDGSWYPVLTVRPSDKLLQRIRAGENGRKDVFLVSFKATTGLTREETYAAGLKALKGSSSNLVLANDVQNHHNVIVTPEEFPYYQDNRDDTVTNLCEMIQARLELDFVRTTVVEGKNADLRALDAAGDIPANFLPVLQHLVDAGAYKVLPWKDSTSGHFGCTVENHDYARVSSVRKANHNKVLEEGVAKVIGDTGDRIIAMGSRPSVGEHTQRMIYEAIAKSPLDLLGVGTEVHSIVHFHCPLRPGVKLATAPQKPYECGSVQCGTNTAMNMAVGEVVGVWAVHLEGHGPNIAFHRSVKAEHIIEYIEAHWDLSAKSGGTVVPVLEKAR